MSEEYKPKEELVKNSIAIKKEIVEVLWDIRDELSGIKEELGELSCRIYKL